MVLSRAFEEDRFKQYDIDLIGLLAAVAGILK
jgi:hypothetical protein